MQSRAHLTRGSGSGMMIVDADHQETMFLIPGESQFNFVGKGPQQRKAWSRIGVFPLPGSVAGFCVNSRKEDAMRTIAVRGFYATVELGENELRLLQKACKLLYDTQDGSEIENTLVETLGSNFGSLALLAGVGTNIAGETEMWFRGAEREVFQ